jgi:hypothetical protein
VHKKSPRGIPDFSRHTPAREAGAHGPAPEGKPAAPPPPRPTTAVKPQTTNAKSGRRGQ